MGALLRRDFRRSLPLARAVVLLLACCGSSLASAAEVRWQVLDVSGAPLPNAVVAVLGAEPAIAPALRAVVDQREKQFSPYVLAVPRGTQVSFPNSDQTRHHVYSFSTAKTFELKLYAGVEAPPVTFETAGTVVLGCNIHDHMIGYVYVLDGAAHAVTDEGGRASTGLKRPGSHRVQVLHPRLPEQGVPLGTFDLEAGNEVVLRIPGKLAPDPRAKHEVNEDEAHEEEDPLQHLFRKGAR